MAGNKNSGRKPKPNAKRTSVHLSNEVYNYLNRNGNVSNEIEKLVEDKMSETYWKDIFGGEVSEEDIIQAAEESGITVADWLQTAYIEMHRGDQAAMDAQIDFDKLAQQITNE